MDIEEILAKRKLREDDVWIPLDETILEEIAELEQQMERHDPTGALRAKRDALIEQAEQDGAAARFTFRQLPARAYRQLVEAHPPQTKGMRWHEPTFAPALIAACCVEPEMTVAQATRIGDEWGEDAYLRLYATAITVNESQTQVPFSVTSTAKTLVSQLNSTSAANGDSPTPTS